MQLSLHHKVNWKQDIQQPGQPTSLKTMVNIPPTADALLQHAKQVACPDNVETNSQDFQQKWPKPKSWGQTWDEYRKKWQPTWINQPIANNSCLEVHVHVFKCACDSESANWHQNLTGHVLNCVNVLAYVFTSIMIVFIIQYILSYLNTSSQTKQFPVHTSEFVHITLTSLLSSHIRVRGLGLRKAVAGVCGIVYSTCSSCTRI